MDIIKTESKCPSFQTLASLNYTFTIRISLAEILVSTASDLKGMLIEYVNIQLNCPKNNKKTKRLNLNSHQKDKRIPLTLCTCQNGPCPTCLSVLRVKNISVLICILLIIDEVEHVFLFS